jgi:hypothetical protein
VKVFIKRQEVHATLIVDNLSKEYRSESRREPPMVFGMLPAALFCKVDSSLTGWFS